jgi:arylsulfatase A-like enzyme
VPRFLTSEDVTFQIPDDITISFKCRIEIEGKDPIVIRDVLAGPGFAAGRRVETPVDLHDLQASLFEATGARRPADWVGRPLQTMPRNDPGSLDEDVYLDVLAHVLKENGFPAG